MEFFKGFRSIRFYIAFMLVMYVAYLMSLARGFYMLGDDNQEKQVKKGMRGIYHK